MRSAEVERSETKEEGPQGCITEIVSQKQRNDGRQGRTERNGKACEEKSRETKQSRGGGTRQPQPVSTVTDQT